LGEQQPLQRALDGAIGHAPGQFAAVREQVTVTADAPLLEASTSSIGKVVDNRRILELPLNTRNVYALVTLTPGIAGNISENHEGLNFSAYGTRRRTLDILIDGVTDRAEDAEALVEWAGPLGRLPTSVSPPPSGVHALGVMVNLIPWNPVPEIDFRESPPQRVRWFKERLEAAKVPVTERLRKGRGVNGACGQLAVLGG